MIWIAWLKDKHAITRQWLSIAKRDVVKQCGGINNLLEWLRKKWKVVKAVYGKKMLKLWENTWNHFDIKLIPNTPITADITKAITAIFTDIEERGVPNYFGEQRFGHWGTNWKIWYELLAGTIRNIKWDKNTLVEKRFKVQAFASYVFNVYLDERQKKWLLYKKIPGDILWKDTATITWPVPWEDLALAGQDAATLEQDVFKKVGLSQHIMDRFKVFWLFWIRRSLVLHIKCLNYRRQHGNLLIAFDLPSGAYATVIVDEIERRLQKMLPQLVVTLEHDKKLPLDPTINPYTGQKINTDKKREKEHRKKMKEQKRVALAKKKVAKHPVENT